MGSDLQGIDRIPSYLLAKGYLKVGEKTLDCSTYQIVSSEPPMRLFPKVFAVLLELARNRGEFVSREELLSKVWPDKTAAPDVVKQAIMEIRRALDSNDADTSVVETLPRKGYRLKVKTAYFESLSVTTLLNNSLLSDLEIDNADIRDSSINLGKKQVIWIFGMLAVILIILIFIALRLLQSDLS